MNGNTDKKRKIMQSLSAFAFALTVFAANAQGSASAETLDSAANGLIVKTAAIESADNEGGEGSVMGKTTDSEANGDDADDSSPSSCPSCLPTSSHPNGCRRDKWYNPCIRSARLRRRDG